MALRNNFDGMSPTEKLVLSQMFAARYIGGGGFLSTSEIARLVGVLDEGRIRNILHSLSERLYVDKRLTGKRSLKWRISSDIHYLMCSVLNDVLGVTIRIDL